ncbi:porphobilinogen deaminase, dipyromethane cofactor binding domain-containing protein [Aspergillus undulatus]|uniref:porphobilinogen deaminase, dipyromethane cofactor binding domain-containing protein n=1 Tax=Aspergillus undulatus TaxID=1810928 RepID=UPI003CCDFFC2
MAAPWSPDIVVGVDFGMTCTGVAYSCGPNWPSPKPIQHWPGLIGSQIATKVPSHILYLPESTKWGFQCEEPLADSANAADSKDIKQFFKLNLDPDFVDTRPNAPSREAAMRYFTDYIQCVYRYVVDYFAKTMPRFEGMKVEFVFSVPTTWKDPRMVEELKGSIQFRKTEHRAAIGLTEAEAAAVYVSELHYQKNDVVLVCDAGGGTTDVNVLKLVSASCEPTVYHPLGFVEGKPVGSVFIDLGVHQLICAKLEPLRMSLPGTPDEIAWQMMTGRFERFKCSFGVHSEEHASLPLDLPSSVPVAEAHFPEHGIYEGQLFISSDEVCAIFDAKIAELFGLLDEQIRRLQLSHPSERISFLVLSGGFGSCPYVRSRLTARYEKPNHLVPEGIKVLTVDEPQLAVVQGQVMNRIQQLKSHTPVFNHLYSPVSYGVICDWLYDPKKHLGEITRYDERNGKTYAINQIDWIVLKGDLIPRTGLSKSFPRKISPRDLSRPFHAQIVMSHSAPTNLPQSMISHDAKLICELEVDTSGVEKKPKNHHWYNRGPVYFLVTVVVRLVIEPAGLGFELWTTGGERIGVRSTTMPSPAIGPTGPILPGGYIPPDPVTIHWENISEKMQDKGEQEGEGTRSRRPVALTVQPQAQRNTVVPEMGADALTMAAAAPKPFRIGTRRSNLAVVQAETIRDSLRKLDPNRTYEIETLHTLGDRDKSTALYSFGAKSLWTAELEEKLTSGEIDVVVHCLKGAYLCHLPSSPLNARFPGPRMT